MSLSPGKGNSQDTAPTPDTGPTPYAELELGMKLGIPQSINEVAPDPTSTVLLID